MMTIAAVCKDDRSRVLARIKAPRRRAFTLIEMCVTVAVIAILLALSLMWLGRAKETAKRMVCLSNLAQLGKSIFQYCEANLGHFPGPAQFVGPWGGPLPGATHGAFAHDWVYFRADNPGIDWTMVNTISPMDQSPIAKYYASGTFNKRWSLLRCPSDLYNFPDGSTMPVTLGGWTPNEINFRNNPAAYNVCYQSNAPSAFYGKPSVYPFSYELNGLLTGAQVCAVSVPGTGQGNPVPLRISRVLRSSDKLLSIEESENSTNDGDWAPGGDFISVRHDRNWIYSDTGNTDPEKKGNGVFVDGHAEWVTRKMTMTAFFYDPSL